MSQPPTGCSRSPVVSGPAPPVPGSIILNDRLAAGGLVVLLLGMAGALALWIPTLSADAPTEQPSEAGPQAVADGIPLEAEPAIVDRIIDGDTIRVVAQPGGSIQAGGSIPVRLLNIDAPELARDGQREECGAQQATRRLEELLGSGDLVWLVADREDRDRFDRPLRQVWDGRGIWINQRMAEDGFVEALVIPPNDRFFPQIQAAVSRAQQEAKGIWGPLCGSSGRG